MELYQEYIKEPKFKKLMAQEELIMEVTESLCELLDKEGISRKELASRLGKTKGFISQLLNGGRNLTLRTLADIVDALGYKINLNIQATNKMKKMCNVIKAPKIHFISQRPWEIENTFTPDNYQSYEMAI